MNAAKHIEARGTGAWATAAARRFFDAILADPGSDGPRLVFADWLLEQGDPLGELIRIQCARPAVKKDERVALRDREHVLHEQYDADWRAPLARLGLRAFKFERGFIAHAQGPGARFAKGFDVIARWPLESFTFTELSPKDAAALAKLPAHPTLVELGFSNCGIGRAYELLASPLFTRVTKLDLEGQKLGDAALAHLAGARLERVERLNLAHTGITSRGVVALARAPWMRRVRELSVQGNTKVDASVLPELAKLGGLRHLEARGTSIVGGAAAQYPFVGGVD